MLPLIVDCHTSNPFSHLSVFSQYLSV